MFWLTTCSFSRPCARSVRSEYRWSPEAFQLTSTSAVSPASRQGTGFPSGSKRPLAVVAVLTNRPESSIGAGELADDHDPQPQAARGIVGTDAGAHRCRRLGSVDRFLSDGFPNWCRDRPRASTPPPGGAGAGAGRQGAVLREPRLAGDAAALARRSCRPRRDRGSRAGPARSAVGRERAARRRGRPDVVAAVRAAIRAGSFGLIQQFGVGVDNIDLDAAADEGVWVANMPGLNA